MPHRLCLAAVTFLTFGLAAPLAAAPPEPTRTPLVRWVDLDVGQSAELVLADGSTAVVKLLRLEETRDSLREAVRRAAVLVEVNGERAELVSANYRLPVTVGGVQIDCAVTRGYTRDSSKRNVWGLERDARLRLWPAGSPWIDPESFGYPVRMRLFASDTQMANEPVFVDGGEIPGRTNIYYHFGLDFGGVEGMVEVVAATDGLVVSSGTEALPGYENTPVATRYDVVYVLDDRGWYYRYSHLKKIDEAIRPGATIKRGERIGLLGKEGGSGGWAHLHFDITARQPSGQWGSVESYAFVWEAYRREYRPQLIALARPHHLTWTGDEVELDGSRSWSAADGPMQYRWMLSDGTTAEGPRVRRTYAKAGTYSEVLEVTDAAGRVGYDFAVVQVCDRAAPQQVPPTIHAAYAPTCGIRAGDPVTFAVRTFRTGGGEVWDFGDGSPPVEVKSDGNARVHAPDGYALTVHRFAEPGDYLVSVRHVNARGEEAVGRLHVRVERAAPQPAP